jgi:integrase
MTGAQAFQSGDRPSLRWVVDFTSLEVSGRRLVASRPYDVTLSFAGLPLSAECCRYLWETGPGRPASTVRHIATSLHHFASFLETTERARFTAEVYSRWLEAMAVDPRFRETSRRATAGHVLRFGRWLMDHGLASRPHVHSAQRRRRRHFRGFGRRRAAEMLEGAVSPQEYLRLVAAIRREVDTCRDLLVAPIEVQEGYPHTLPLLPCVMLMGVLLAVRSAELNAAVVGDVRLRDGAPWIHLHAPDKEPGDVFLVASVVEALEIAQRWMARYRPDPLPEEPLLAICHPFTGEVVRFDTIWLREGLRQFYAKYFALTDDDGVPLLYREVDGERLPFSLSFKQFRSAAITEAARHERNPEHLRIFARHRSVTTTLKYYVKHAYLEWVENVSLKLQPSAELHRIAMKGRVARPQDAAAAALAGALLPGGHCQEALDGIVGCLRATDCRRCAHFRIHPDRRSYFVADRDEALVQLQRADVEGRKRDAEVAAGRVALNEAVLGRIDDYFAGVEDAA